MKVSLSPIMPEIEKIRTFESALSDLINRHSMESLFGNLPDFILARHAVDELTVLSRTTREVNSWHNEAQKEGPDV